MTVLVIGDVHIHNFRAFGGTLREGLNDRCRDILSSLQECVESFKASNGVTAVVQLGDFFDQPRPSPAVVDAAIRMIKSTGVPWHILSGNHDIASYDAPSALAPLAHVEGIFVYEKPCLVDIEGVHWVMCPYTGPDAVEALKHANALAAAGPADATYVLAAHYGLVDAKLSVGSRADVVELHAAKTLLPNVQSGYFGHEHNSRAVRNGLWSLGGYTQTGFGDHGYPIVGVVGTKKDAQNNLGSFAWGRAPRFSTAWASPDYDLRRVQDLQYFLLDACICEYPSYFAFDQKNADMAEALSRAGIIRGYKLVEGGVSAVEEIVANEPGGLPMDTVYEVLATEVDPEIVENVLELVEQDMRASQ